MAENSKIQWTTHTFNPWVGCQRVSPGCEHCYAEAYDKRVGGAKLPDGTKSLRWGPMAPRVRTSAANWRKPLAWDKAAAAAGERPRVFCSSLADVFEDRPELVPWRAELFALIAKTPHLDWLLLTKRPENILRLWPEVTFPSGERCYRPGSDWWPNVWLGTTVEDQRRADERIPHLLRVPAKVRFLSCEPLLESVDLAGADGGNDYLGDHHDDDPSEPGIDWVIIGGESGPGARPFHLDWARDLVAQARAAGVAPFVKQLEAVSVMSEEEWRQHPEKTRMLRARNALRAPLGAVPILLNDRAGGDMAEWPEDLRVREFPS